MTTTFVILAAGRGSRIGRVGDDLHKCLVPLQGRAIISHLIDLAPDDDTKFVVMLGHRNRQVQDYLDLAHPDVDIETVVVAGWDKPGGGPGHSLLAARPFIEGDLVFTSCDTLWQSDPELWAAESSWSAVDGVPVGTTPDRWCRLVVDDDAVVTHVLDKTQSHPEQRWAYVGMSQIIEADQAAFFAGIEKDNLSTEGERQVSNGLRALTETGDLMIARVKWTDVGDAASYRRAVIEADGYDWSKEGEATWLLPRDERVVKYWRNPQAARQRWMRGRAQPASAQPIELRDNMLSYKFAPGVPVYDARMDEDAVRYMMDWIHRSYWRPVNVRTTGVTRAAAQSFYYDKTMDRVNMLPPTLKRLALDVVARVDWDAILNDVKPVQWHGDLNFGNIIFDGQKFTGIDWRGEFDGGNTSWGDRRYDLAKLLVGCRINWSDVRKGIWSPWADGKWMESVIRSMFQVTPATEMIAALTLLNSAPLHASPLDEVLVVRAAAWIDGMYS